MPQSDLPPTNRDASACEPHRVPWWLSLGRGTLMSAPAYRQHVLQQAEPQVIDETWETRKGSRPSFLMLCHDKRVDRRILQQAHALQDDGWVGQVICMSTEAEDSLEVYEGVDLHRVGQGRLVPRCPVFWDYQERQRLIQAWGWGKALLSTLSRKLYKRSLWRTYQSPFFYPLPYDDALCAAARHYPADVVIAHDLTALPAGHQMARTWGVPLVYDAHELYYEQAVFSPVQKKLMAEVEGRLIRDCDVAFTVNGSIAQEMHQRYGCQPVRVLLNVTDPPEDFDPTGSYTHIRDHLGLPEDKVILLFQGGMIKNRNLEALVDAMAEVQHPDAVLVMLGFGKLQAALQARVAEKSLQGRVYFIEAVPQSELIYWSASADVGIIPYPPIDLNTLYCTPNKLFEFIQAGVPILANDSPELRRFVHDTGFGQVGAMESSQAIARLLDSAVADATWRSKAKTAMMANRHQYAWAYAKAEYLHLIRQACQNPQVVPQG